MIRNIQEIVKEIKNTNAILNQDIENIPYAQRPAVEIAITRAREKLPKLLEEIKQLVIPYRLVGLFATGNENSINEVGQFLAKNEGLVLDANKLYNDITALVEPSYGTEREFCTTQYHLMVQAVSSLAVDFGYLEVEPPKFINQMCPTKDDTLKLIKEVVRDCGAGDQINVDLIKKTIIDWVVRCNIEAKQIPVLIVGVTNPVEKNKIATLFCRTIDYNFEANFTVNAKTITALFSKKPINVDKE